MTEESGSASAIPQRDRLPKWIYDRYDSGPGFHQPWEQLDKGSRIYWQEEADTVIKAVLKLAIYKIVKDE